MFDFSWSELALIAVVALVVIGPKDLPRVMKNVAFWVRKARSMAREFQGSIEEMMRDAELDDVKRDLDQATRFNFDEEMSKTIDPQGELRRSLSAPELSNPLADQSKSETTPDALQVTPGNKPPVSSPPGQGLAEAGQAVLPPDEPHEPDAAPPPVDQPKRP
ncbi:MAG: twin-arginine translocase subunit TatB [Alphaproteobacteria bacterium]|nr:twin-arginine translocase subunit TatB [Alphaproteobacteria bacterium]